MHVCTMYVYKYSVDMYLLCMIKARIRWCTCRVENILTLGKLLKSVVLFPHPFYFFFDISNLLSYIQNNFKL